MTRNKRELLHDFEWHDLPVDEIAIGVDGVSLLVTPYAEASGTYRRLRLILSAPEHLHLNVAGALQPADLSALEVSSFEILEESDDRLSGHLGILLRAAGFWTIEFTGAAWELVELAPAP